MSKIFHHIYFQFDKTNKINKEDLNNINLYLNKNLNGWEYKLWQLNDAVKFIEDEYPCFINFFNSKTNFPIIKCDFFRYLLMYHFGGIYTDLDFLIIKPIDNFINDLRNKKIFYTPTTNTPNIILTEEWENSFNTTNTLHNGILISFIKKHPLWLSLIFEIFNDYNNNNLNITNNDQVFEKTGTKKLCKIVKNNLNTYSDVIYLPYYYFCPFLAKQKNKITVCNGPITIPSLNESNWVFINISQHEEINILCPISYFVCVYLNNGSMWK